MWRCRSDSCCNRLSPADEPLSLSHTFNVSRPLSHCRHWLYGGSLRTKLNTWLELALSCSYGKCCVTGFQSNDVLKHLHTGSRNRLTDQFNNTSNTSEASPSLSSRATAGWQQRHSTTEQKPTAMTHKSHNKNVRYLSIFPRSKRGPHQSCSSRLSEFK